MRILSKDYFKGADKEHITYPKGNYGMRLYLSDTDVSDGRVDVRVEHNLSKCTVPSGYHFIGEYTGFNRYFANRISDLVHGSQYVDENLDEEDSIIRGYTLDTTLSTFDDLSISSMEDTTIFTRKFEYAFAQVLAKYTLTKESHKLHNVVKKNAISIHGKDSVNEFIHSVQIQEQERYG